MRALVRAGVDCLIIETCQDLLQVKTVLVACFELLEELNVKNLPVLSSVTFERQGTMLVGSDISAVCATIAPFPVFSLGLNCATGPGDMESHIHYLSQNWPKRISCIPNQGMPEVLDGKTHYPLSPQNFARHMFDFVTRYGVSIVGCCCGTSSAHIKALADTLAGVLPARRSNTPPARLWQVFIRPLISDSRLARLSLAKGATPQVPNVFGNYYREMILRVACKLVSNRNGWAPMLLISVRPGPVEMKKRHENVYQALCPHPQSAADD